MKEIISAIIIAVALLGAGTKLIGAIHDQVREAALTKAAMGLPALPRVKEKMRR